MRSQLAGKSKGSGLIIALVLGSGYAVLYAQSPSS